MKAVIFCFFLQMHKQSSRIQKNLQKQCYKRIYNTNKLSIFYEIINKTKPPKVIQFICNHCGLRAADCPVWQNQSLHLDSSLLSMLPTCEGKLQDDSYLVVPWLNATLIGIVKILKHKQK